MLANARRALIRAFWPEPLWTRITTRNVPILLLALLAAPLAATPTITFERDGALLSGLQPGASVAWLVVTRELQGYVTVVREESILVTDDDEDGSVRFSLERNVPAISLFAAVELKTGTAAVATPASFEAGALAAPVEERDPKGEESRIAVAARELALLLVRPGKGVWEGLAGDGGGADADSAPNGRILLSIPSLTPVDAGGAAPPKTLAPGDVLVAIDVARLAYDVSTVVAGSEEPAGGR